MSEVNSIDPRLINAAPMLAEALAGLLADIEDYQRINNLGGELNHWQVRARAALVAAGVDRKPKSPGCPLQAMRQQYDRDSAICDELVEGLNADDQDAKQWHMEQALKLIAPDEFKECKSSWGWADGVEPA